MFKGTLANLWRPVLGTAILAFMSGLMLQLSARQDIPLETFQTTSLVTQAVRHGGAVPARAVGEEAAEPGCGLQGGACPFRRPVSCCCPSSGTGQVVWPTRARSWARWWRASFCWCMAAEAVHDTKLPAVLLFSCTFLCTNAAQLAGTLVGFFNASTLAQGDVALTAVALVAVYLVAMVSMFLFKDRKTQCQGGRGGRRAATGRCVGGALQRLGRRIWLHATRNGDTGASGARPYGAGHLREALRFRKHGEVPHQVHLPESSACTRAAKSSTSSKGRKRKVAGGARAQAMEA